VLRTYFLVQETHADYHHPIAVVGKLVHQKSHWQKTKNTSEPQNEFVVSNTVH